MLLKNKKIIFVGHLVTKKFGDRYDVLCLIKSYCKDNNLLFIDPIAELKLTHNNVNELISDAVEGFAHYNAKGHDAILKIYEKYINLTNIGCDKQFIASAAPLSANDRYIPVPQPPVPQPRLPLAMSSWPYRTQKRNYSMKLKFLH
jgi:hypothetical protein